MDSTKDWLEAVVKKRAYEESPIKVLEMETIPNAMGAGVNFQSKIGLIKAKVLLGSGKIRNLTLIVKDMHDAGPIRMMSTQLGVFNREIAIYRDVLPKMENLLEEIGDYEGRFWPISYDVRLYDRIILEDLRESGYKTGDKIEMLGLDAAVLTVRQIAKFHAMSRVLMDRGEIPVNVFGSHIFDNNVAAAFLIPMMNQNVAKFTGAVERWGDDWKAAAEKLRKCDNFGEVFMQPFKADPTEFTVLGHGDCWLNNILFKGDDRERPLSVRFIDFQQSFIASPAVDLTHFLVASVRLETRENHLDDILQAYCDSLKSTLEKCGREGPVPSLEDIKAALDKRGMLQLFFAIALAPIQQDTTKLPDMANLPAEVMEAMMTTGQVPPEFDIYNRLDQRTEKLLKAELKRAIANGHL